jgi:hypothetical protein
MASSEFDPMDFPSVPPAPLKLLLRECKHNPALILQKLQQQHTPHERIVEQFEEHIQMLHTKPSHTVTDRKVILQHINGFRNTLEQYKQQHLATLCAQLRRKAEAKHAFIASQRRELERLEQEKRDGFRTFDCRLDSDGFRLDNDGDWAVIITIHPPTPATTTSSASRSAVTAPIVTRSMTEEEIDADFNAVSFDNFDCEDPLAFLDEE